MIAIVFIISYLLVMGLLVYTINLPAWITKNPKLVDEYYFKNPLKSLIMDFIFILGYWGVAYLVWTNLGVETTVKKGIVLIICTALLTTLFWFGFTRKDLNPENFFSRWFHTVGLSSVIYDMILIGVLFMVYDLLLKNFNR